MGLADDFQEIIDALPSDWTDLELDVRVQEDRYIDSAVALVTCNAQPYSNHDWHFRIACAHTFGHAAAPSALRASLRLLAAPSIRGELESRAVRRGRGERVKMSGGSSSVRE